jgi:hypothetical protein
MKSLLVMMKCTSFERTLAAVVTICVTNRIAAFCDENEDQSGCHISIRSGARLPAPFTIESARSPRIGIVGSNASNV